MICKTTARAAALFAAVSIVAGCGGGGGGGSNPPPTADTTPPDTALGGGPAASTNQRTATFTFTATEANSTFEGSLDGAAFAAVASPHTLNNLADDAHTFNVRARDAANNVDASPATFNWTVDATAPTVSVVFPGTRAYTDAATIRLRGTARDAATISSLTVNGAAATSTDAFRNWTATVNVNAGANTFTIATTDTLGNTNGTAATVLITNRGLVPSFVTSMALDAAHDRVLAIDRDRGAILALRLSDGMPSIFADMTHGTGFGYFDLGGLSMHVAGNVAYTYDVASQRVVSIDLATGNRDYVSAQPASSSDYVYGSLRYNAATNRAYVTSLSPAVVQEIDLNNNNRRFVARNQLGGGPTMVQPIDALVDTSATGGGTRLLLADVGAIPGESSSRLFSIDLATGTRAVLSTSGTPGAGSGPAMFGISDLALDAPNNRAIVSEYSTLGNARLLAIDLTTGNRTVLVDTGVRSTASGVAFEAGSSRAYLAIGDRSRILSFTLANQQLAPFHEALAGSGPSGISFNSLRFETVGGVPALIAGAQTQWYGGATGVYRIDAGSGSRSIIASETVGTGEPPRVAMGAQRDTRVGAPANQILMYDSGFIPGRLVGIDSNTGNRTMLWEQELGYLPSRNLVLDPASARLLLEREQYPEAALIAANAATGAITTVSEPGVVGTGPGFGDIQAVGIDAPAGGARRYIVLSVTTSSGTSSGTLTAVDPATGARNVISSLSVGSGAPMDWPGDIEVDTAGGRALLLGLSGTLQFVDLANGNRTLVSGADSVTSRGSGPSIVSTGLGPRIAADFTAGVAYSTSHSNAIVAVDLGTGERAIISR